MGDQVVTKLDVFKAEKEARECEHDERNLMDEMGTTLDVRAYYRDFDIPDHKNDEAAAKAKMDAVVFRAKRYTQKPDQIAAVVAAVTEATIATGRRMAREAELARMERKIVELQEKAEKLGVVFPAEWVKSFKS